METIYAALTILGTYLVCNRYCWFCKKLDEAHQAEDEALENY